MVTRKFVVCWLLVGLVVAVYLAKLPHVGRFIALDAATGEVRWMAEAQLRSWPNWVVEGERLFAWENQQGVMTAWKPTHLVAKDAKTGAVLWTWQPKEPEVDLEYWSNITDGRLYASANRVYVLIGGTKTEASENPPGLLVALDARTGAVQWRTQHPGFIADRNWFTPLLVPVGRQVMLLTQQPGKGVMLRALNRGDGILIWEAPDLAAVEYLTAYNSSFPCLLTDGTHLFVATDENLRAYDPATGRLLWQRAKSSLVPVEQPAPEFGDASRGSRWVVANPSGLYVLAGEGPGAGVTALEPATGAEQWYKPVGPLGANATLQGGAEGLLYLLYESPDGPMRAVTALRAETGEILWQRVIKLPEELWDRQRPTLPGAHALLVEQGQSATRSNVVALSAQDGTEQWQSRATVESYVTGDGETVLFLSRWRLWRLWLMEARAQWAG